MGFEQPAVEEGPADPLEEACEKIMSFAEYRELEHPRPYLYELRAGGRSLDYYGAHHSVDPEDPEFEDIRTRFEAFATAHPGGTVVIEGGLHPSDALKDAESAKRLGEPAYTQFLAERAGLKVISPEADERAQTDGMRAEGYADDEIVAYWMLKQMKYVREIEGREPSPRDLGKWYLDATTWTGTSWLPDMPARHELVQRLKAGEVDEVWRMVERAGTASKARFDEVFKKTTGQDFDYGKAEAYCDPADFSEVHSRFNRMGAISSEVRDREIVRGIGREALAGKDTFIVFGSSHAVMQEPALRKFFETLQV